MPDSKPNILVIRGDDIGIWNLSCYSRGRWATARPTSTGSPMRESFHRFLRRAELHGRAIIIHHRPERLPHRHEQGRNARDGCRPAEGGPDDRRVAQADRLRHRPNRQEPPRRPEQDPADRARFDEFFGNLYHLNAEEEPENADYPTEEKRRYSPGPLPRGVIHSWATDEDSGEVDERYGPVGKQRIEDTGPLTKKRMETIDDETTGACIDFIGASTRRRPVLRLDEHDAHALPDPHQAGEPRPVRSVAVAVPRHDDRPRPQVGQMLDPVDELGHRRGHHRHLQHRQRPHANSWPDGATTPFRSEKATNWKAPSGYRR